jgi:hypothetical protein
LEKANRSAVQFGKKIFETARRCPAKGRWPINCIRKPRSTAGCRQIALLAPLASHPGIGHSDTLEALFFQATRGQWNQAPARRIWLKHVEKAQEGSARTKTRTRTMAINERPVEFADLAAIASAVARSQIIFRRILAWPMLRIARRFDLPAGFEDVDIAILEWIAAEGRRTHCDYLPL